MVPNLQNYILTQGPKIKKIQTSKPNQEIITKSHQLFALFTLISIIFSPQLILQKKSHIQQLCMNYSDGRQEFTNQLQSCFDTMMSYSTMAMEKNGNSV